MKLHPAAVSKPDFIAMDSKFLSGKLRSAGTRRRPPLAAIQQGGQLHRRQDGCGPQRRHNCRLRGVPASWPQN
jgi:hypothetical protein